MFFSKKSTPSPGYVGEVTDGAALNGNDVKDGTALNGNTYDPHIYTDAAAPSDFSAAEERKLLAKIDFRLMPVLSILYLLAFLDRTNIGNAAVYGLATDLGVAQGSNDYNTALTLFFPLYCVCEIPSNVLLKQFKPHVWLSLCMLAFGFITICQGLVSSVQGLWVTRLFLGLAETGMFPGCFYLIGMWYKRYEAQKRFSFFFSSTSLAGAFGGLLAAALSNMAGLRGYKAWRWIFIIEGLLTCVVAIAFFFVIPDFPEDSKFFSAREKEFVKKRLEVDQGKAALDRTITLKDVRNVFKDYKIIVAGFMYFGLIVPAYGYAFFAPGIISGFGYSQVQTQLHSVPPWAASFGFAMVVAFISDRMRHRYLFAMLCSGISIAGFAILLSPVANTVKYGALFLVTCGTYTALPLLVCWFNMNLGGHHRRAVGSAWQIGFGNTGGIISTYAFLPKDKPAYVPGYAICIGFVGLSMVAATVYFVGVLRANRQRRSLNHSGLTEYESTEKGDMSPKYRYMY